MMMNFAEHVRGGKRASNRVYIDNSMDTPTPTPTTEASTQAEQEPTSASTPAKASSTRKRVTLKLSHDISTEQLFSDQLIDGKVLDGEDDDMDDDADDADTNDHSRRRSSHQQKSRRSNHRKASRHSSTTKNTTLLPSQSEDAASALAESPKAMYRIESHSHLSSLDAKHLDKHQQFAVPSVDAVSGKPSNRVSLVPLGKATAATPTIAVDGEVCDKCRSTKDMPPLHCAAYAGHVHCLSLLLDERVDAHVDASVDASTRPYYLDKKRRTPLFYSCAANRIDCCTLLLARRSDWRDLADKQQDTPVHVCCFFGWHECLQKLLDAGADPHGRNAKGFKPSHIAKTKECLELLLSYGDDLQQGDKVGRTPLFVACARDRSICVEFLCGWNHKTRSWMLEQEDQRGDKPIHAAACNGSNASLAMLLRFGADPLVQNANGFTPKDLAVANNHPKCVELLTAAEHELANANTWFAPASLDADNQQTNELASAPTQTDSDGWIECWDNTSGQPFYYHNLSGKCQWEVPEGFTPHLLQLIHHANEPQRQHHQQQSYEDDENGEYVWVKKKRQTVCVATGKESEWTAVQDPISKAIYYKNTRTGQSQWEEPDAVQQLQNASVALASQQATKVWDDLDASRTALAKALVADRQRQLLAQQAALDQHKLEIQRRRADIRKREEQAKLQLLLPRSSFIRRKKQSMMIKIKGSPQAQEEDKMEQICQREPSLDIFLSTYVRLQGVRDLQLSIEKRFFNCLFHYYVALVDPVHTSGLSKSQFRTVLRDAGVIPSSFGGGGANTNNSSSFSNLRPPTNQTPTLKLHVVDLIFAQAARVEAMETSNANANILQATNSFMKNAAHSASHSSLVHSQQHRHATASGATTDSRLRVVGFVAAMQIVRERLVALAEEQNDADTQQPVEIDDDEEWFLTTYLLPLTVRLGGKMLILIRECKELDLEITASDKLQSLLSQNRHAVQRLHRYYTSQEANKQLKILTFRGLAQFAQEFSLVPQHLQLPALHQLYEAVNWISGHAHTEIISFEKFQQLLTILAMRTQTRTGSDDEDSLVQALTASLRQLEASPAVHRVASATRAAAEVGGDGFAISDKNFFVVPPNVAM